MASTNLGEQLSLLPGVSSKLDIPFDLAIEKIAYQMEGPQPIDLVCKAIRAAHELGMPFEIKTVVEEFEFNSGNPTRTRKFKYEVKIGELEDRRDEG